VVAGDQAVAALDVYESSGSLTLRIRWDAGTRQPDADDIAVAKREFARSMAADTIAARRALALMPERRTVPVFRDVLIGRDNRIWVERYPAGADSLGMWWVFDEGGSLEAVVEVPRHLDLLQADDGSVIVRAMDELDVERIEIRPIVESERGEALRAP
jgi:hypothetical protein